MRAYWFTAHWHFSTLLHIKLPGAQSCMPTVNWERDWSFYWYVHRATLTFWVCSVSRMGKVMVVILNSASIPAWKAPPSSPSTRRSGSAAEHVSWSGPGFSFLLKDTGGGWMFTNTVNMLFWCCSKRGGGVVPMSWRSAYSPEVHDRCDSFPLFRFEKKVFFFSLLSIFLASNANIRKELSCWQCLDCSW